METLDIVEALLETLWKGKDRIMKVHFGRCPHWSENIHPGMIDHDTKYGHTTLSKVEDECKSGETGTKKSSGLWLVIVHVRILAI